MRRNLEGLVKQKLLEIAKKLHIPYPARLSKSELISQIKKIDKKKETPVKSKTRRESHMAVRVRLKRDLQHSKPGFVHPHSEGVIHPPDVPHPEVHNGGHLPQGYGVTKIVLLVRDPYWCYTYWDFSQETVKQIERWFHELQGPKAVLRVYDVTDRVFDGTNANSYFDVSVNFDPRNWYLDVGKSDRNFLVDIGIVDRQGRFYLIARSNVIRTPRDTPSDVIDEEWMSKDFELLYAISGGFKIGSSSAELVEKVKKGVLFRKWISSGALSSRS